LKVKFLLLKVKAGYGLGQFGELYELLLLDQRDHRVFKAQRGLLERQDRLDRQVSLAQLVQYLMSLALKDLQDQRVHKVMLENKV
jgi:hypothetical protein